MRPNNKLYFSLFTLFSNAVQHSLGTHADIYSERAIVSKHKLFY